MGLASGIAAPRRRFRHSRTGGLVSSYIAGFGISHFAIRLVHAWILQMARKGEAGDNVPGRVYICCCLHCDCSSVDSSLRNLLQQHFCNSLTRRRRPCSERVAAMQILSELVIWMGKGNVNHGSDDGGSQAAVPLQPFSGDDYSDSDGAYLWPDRSNASNLPTSLPLTKWGLQLGRGRAKYRQQWA